MNRTKKVILGMMLIGTIVAMATREVVWDFDLDWVYGATTEVRSETEANEVVWIGNDGVIEKIPKTPTQHPQEKYFLKNVQNFGPLYIGGKAPTGIVLHPDTIPHDVQFYIYYHRMGFGMCNNEDCAPLEGQVVKCMNGWLAGSDQHEGSHEVGLDHDLVRQGIASMVVVSDRNEKIIGIFPYHTESDIIPILNTFPEFQESLTRCFEKYLEALSDPTEGSPRTKK